MKILKKSQRKIMKDFNAKQTTAKGKKTMTVQQRKDGDGYFIKTFGKNSKLKNIIKIYENS